MSKYDWIFCCGFHGITNIVPRIKKFEQKISGIMSGNFLHSPAITNSNGTCYWEFLKVVVYSLPQSRLHNLKATLNVIFR